jgi:hypothetical protein
MSQIEVVGPATCPFATAAAPPARSRADDVVRRLLRVETRTGTPSARAATGVFTRSMAISTIRCTLTYLVFPFVLPALGLVSDTGVVLGAIIGVVAIACNVMSMRRVFAADHRWRWPFSIASFVVSSLLVVLLVQDIVLLAT